MKLLAAAGTFVASYIVPGWGFWIVGKPRLGLAASSGIIVLIVLFSWTRLVVDPGGYVTLVALTLVLVFWSATHSSIIEFRRDPATSSPRNWKGSLAYAVVAFGVLYPLLSYRAYTLGYEVFHIPSRSMAPTLMVDDYIVVDTWHYSEADIVIGEIAVFEAPGRGEVNMIKRVVGLPGDVLMHANNQLIRNGVAVIETHPDYDTSPFSAAGSFSEITVPDGMYFVMGDNRNNSRDSRHMGAIPKEHFLGRAAHIWYSTDVQLGIQWQRFPNTID